MRMSPTFLVRFFPAFALAVVLAAAFVSPVRAEGSVIAVLNIQEIMNDSTAAKSVREQLNKKQKSFQAEMDKKEKELQNEEENLNKARSTITPEAFEEKVREFRKHTTVAQKDLQSKKVQLDNAFKKALSDIQKAVYDIVQEMAKEKGFQVVVPTSQLLYADTSLDISKEVLVKLNKNLPTLKVDFK